MIEVEVKPYRMRYAITNDEWDEDFGEEVYVTPVTVDTGVEVSYVSRFWVSKLKIDEKYITRENAFIRASVGSIIKFIGHIRVTIWSEEGRSDTRLWIRESLHGRDFGVCRCVAEDLGLIPALNNEIFQDWSDIAGYRLYSLNCGL